MSWGYEPREYGAFSDQLASLPPDIQLLIIEAIQTRLRIDPCSEKDPVRSKMLRGELYCIRRIHVTDEIVVAYTVCDDCRSRSCVKKLQCFYCFEEPPWRVKLLACGPWTGFYNELNSHWKTWINTVTRAREA